MSVSTAKRVCLACVGFACVSGLPFPFMTGNWYVTMEGRTTSQCLIGNTGEPAGCGVISLNPLPVIKGIMSRLVNENRQGALFANVYFLEAVCRLAGSSVFFNIYADTQYLMRGFVYLVYSGFFAVGAILMIPLLFSSRRDLRKSKEISVQV
eukprot:XP_011429952.1 PREDICTED: proton-coupled folate transporter [Crassostrea gigas]